MTDYLETKPAGVADEGHLILEACPAHLADAAGAPWQIIMAGKTRLVLGHVAAEAGCWFQNMTFRIAPYPQ